VEQKAIPLQTVPITLLWCSMDCSTNSAKHAASCI